MVFCKKVKALSHRASARKKRALCLGINAYGVILYKDTNSSEISQRTYPQRIKLYCESSPCRDQVNLTSGTSVDSESCRMIVS